MNQRMMILRVLRDGPGTSSEVSAETGLPLRQTSAILSTLYRAGRLHRKKYVRERERAIGAYVYSRRQA